MYFPDVPKNGEETAANGAPPHFRFERNFWVHLSFAFFMFGPFIGREVSYYRGVQAVAAAMPPKREPAPLALSLEADPIGDVIADRGEGLPEKAPSL